MQMKTMKMNLMISKEMEGREETKRSKLSEKSFRRVK